MVSEDEIAAAMCAGWSACRKSVYAVCEDVQDKAHNAPDDGTSEHVTGFNSGTKWAAKSIARGFNSMEAMDDDNLRKALLEVSK